MEVNICPRWVLAQFRVPERMQHHIALLISTLVTLALLPLVSYLPHFCLAQKALGIPCPGCGVIHSVQSLLQLNVANAWAANPSGIVVAVLFGFQLLARPIALLDPRREQFVSMASRNISNVALGCLLLVWIQRVT